MNKFLDVKVQKIFFTFTCINIISAACSSIPASSIESELKDTVSAQSTWIAHLSTQVAQQDQTNINQEKNIFHLYTQMPYALGTITPIPPGVTITRTPYPLSDQAFESTFTPTPSPSIDIEYPPDTRTGLDEIDNVIDAILSEGIDARLELVRFTTTACTTTDGLGGPPKCEPGEADQTIVGTFPVSNGEGYHIRPDKIQTIFDFTIRGLAAVYVVPVDAYHTEYWPAGEYGVIFTSEEGGYPHLITVLVENGQIVRLEFSPGWPPFDLIRQKSDEFILSPIR